VTFIPFPAYRPDVDDFRGQHTQALSGVLPRGDGYGPMAALQSYTLALPGVDRGMFYARRTDGTIIAFAGTADRLYRLDNTSLDWVPVSKVTALTSISNGSPAVFTLNSHGLSDGDRLTLTTSGALPTGLSTGTTYYVINSATNTFNVSLTSGGAAVNTTGAGSGTHSMTYFYTDLSTTDQWQFAQFGNTVIAVQANSAPQAFDISSGSTLAAFADLGGSPPNARYIMVVGRFVVLMGLTSTPNRVQWSDLDGITTWTAGTGFSNYYDVPDGGIVRGGAGGEFGVVFQESAIRRMVYIPGNLPAFQIERISEDEGLLGPYSIIRAGSRIFFVSQSGFRVVGASGAPVPIGREKVDRTFLADLDAANLHVLVGAADPASSRVFWAYKSEDTSSTTQFDKLIAYDWALERWSPPISVAGEYLGSLVKPGLTLEGLDAISSDLDALDLSSLDSVQAALLSKLAAFDGDHKLGFFDGDNLEATLEVPEQGAEGRRVFVRGFEVRTDAATVYGSVKHRANAQSTPSATSETLVNAQGICPQRIETKLARAKIRIPAGTSWTYAMGVEPDFVPTGRR
jgi:hypothetical protein